MAESIDLDATQNRVYSLRSKYERLNYALSFERDGVRTKIETALRRGHIGLTEEIKLATAETRPAQFLRSVLNIPDVERFVRNDARERLASADNIMKEIIALREQFRGNALQLLDTDIETLTVSLPKWQAEIDFAAAAQEGAARFEEKTRRKSGRAAPRGRAEQRAFPRSGALKIEGIEDTGAFGETEDEADAAILDERTPRNDTEHLIFELQHLLTHHGAADTNELAVYAEELDRAESKFADLRGSAAERFMGILKQAHLFFETMAGLQVDSDHSLEKDTRKFLDAQIALAAAARQYGIPSHPVFNRSKVGNRRKAMTQWDNSTQDEADETARLYTARNFTTANFLWRLLNETLRRAQSGGEDTHLHYDIYHSFLRDLSLRLRPRASREAPAILHSAHIDVKGFRKKLKNNEFPENLWRQQRELLHAVERALKHGKRRIYFETPPGTGKTRVLLLLAQMLNPKGNTLLLVPNRNLVEQHEGELAKSKLCMPHGKVGQFEAEFDQPLTIATYRGLQRPLQQGLFPRDKFSLILLDEVHKTLGLERDRILEYFPQATVIGATGSGQDADGTEVNRTFKCAYYISLLDGIRAGMVNPIRLHRANMPPVGGIMNGKPVTDILREDLENRINAIIDWYEKVCRGTGRDGRDKQVLIIMDTNERADALAKALREKGVRAEAIHAGRMFIDVYHADILFREGDVFGKKLPVAVTSQLLVEGWDYDGLECIVIGDQSDSGAYYLQRMGRVARRVDKNKKDSHVLMLRGGVAKLIPGRGGRGNTVTELPLRTPVEELFGLDGTFRSGRRIAEPQEGFWPKNPFKFPS